jgi:hypothetical protein
MRTLNCPVPFEFHLFGSPAYLALRGTPRSPADFAKHHNECNEALEVARNSLAAVRRFALVSRMLSSTVTSGALSRPCARFTVLRGLKMSTSSSDRQEASSELSGSYSQCRGRTLSSRSRLTDAHVGGAQSSDAAPPMRIISDIGRVADEVQAPLERAGRRVDVHCFIVRDDRLGPCWANLPTVPKHPSRYTAVTGAERARRCWPFL